MLHNKKVIYSAFQRINGFEGRASCYWRAYLEVGDPELLEQHDGYLFFEGIHQIYYIF